MTSSVESEEAGHAGDGVWADHAQDRFKGGGRAHLAFVALAELARLEGNRRRSRVIGCSQHGHLTTCGGLGAGVTTAPMSNGRPVWKAMRSRFALARPPRWPCGLPLHRGDRSPCALKARSLPGHGHPVQRTNPTMGRPLRLHRPTPPQRSLPRGLPRLGKGKPRPTQSPGPTTRQHPAKP